MITRGGGTKAGDYQRDAPPALLHGPLVFFTPMFSEARPDLRVTLLEDISNRGDIMAPRHDITGFRNITALNR